MSDYITFMIVCLMGFITGASLYQESITNVELEIAAANCSSNNGIEYIATGFSTVVVCKNGAKFTINETKQPER